MPKTELSPYFQSLKDFDQAVKAAQESPTKANKKLVEERLIQLFKTASEHTHDCFSEDHIREVGEASRIATQIGIDAKKYTHLLTPSR